MVCRDKGDRCMTPGEGTEQLAERCNRLMRSIVGLARDQDSEWLALDLGMGQFKAMVILREHGRQTVGGLARTLKISEPSASLLVDKLVARDLVARSTDPEDRRRTLVAITQAGSELMVRLRRSREDQLAGWLAGMAGEDLQALARGLQAMVVSIRGGSEGSGLSVAGPVGAEPLVKKEDNA